MKRRSMSPGLTGAVQPAVLLFSALLLGACGQQPPPEVAWEFSAMAQNGDVMPYPGAGGHHCVLDGRTGLLWEAKRPEPGLHHQDAVFTWYHGDKSEHLGEPGLEGGGSCSLERCDTEAFVAAVNAVGLCGRSDWRMPSRDEALSIMDRARIGKGPTLDPVYFPAEAGAEFWTGTTFRMYPKGAWAVDTIYALDRVDDKVAPKRVRLVSGPKDAVKPKGRGR